MINIFFVPGMFGTTIEYVLRSYTPDAVPIDAKICNDGSMHSFKKQKHLSDIGSVEDFLSKHKQVQISTPIYPFEDTHLGDILNIYKQYRPHGDKNILIYADSLNSVELNLLFVYYKVITGNLNLGLGIYLDNVDNNIMHWNKNYTHWTQMQQWELREWISLFYVSLTREWIDSFWQVDNSFLKVKNTDILHDPYQAISQIAEFCNLTITDNAKSFLLEWQQRQQYILDEFLCLDQITNQTIDHWKPLSIISEAILQQRFRSKGFELQCHNLNTFPTDSDSLYKLLKKC